MRFLRRIISGQNQLHWAIAALLAAVGLSTVCLIAFMVQGIGNVEVLVRQELMKICREKIGEISSKANESWDLEIEQVDALLKGKSKSDAFAALFAADHPPLIVYDEHGERFYPPMSSDVNMPDISSDDFQRAQHLEFAGQEFREAAEAYETAANSDDTYVRFTAMIGKARCLNKLGETDDAINVCREVAFSPEMQTCDTATLMLIARAQLFLASLVRAEIEKNDGTYEPLLVETGSKQRELLALQNDAGAVVPLDLRGLLTRPTIEPGDLPGDGGVMPASLQWPKSFDAIAETIGVIERFPTAAGLRNRPRGKFQRLDPNDISAGYSAIHSSSGCTILLIQDQFLAIRIEALHRLGFSAHSLRWYLADDRGDTSFPANTAEGRVFMAVPMDEAFTGWTAEIVSRSDNPLDRATRKRRSLYLWGGGQSIVLLVVAAAFVLGAARRQMKLSSLKNDFIATVTHELRTPLASMRVMIDTLIEGNYKDQQQVTEYLQLAAKENERLSRLIDNFLTFSRMERNKQAFEMASVDPVAIVRDVEDVVRAKFDNDRCSFEVKVQDGLPNVSADRDAIVTVLANLLDNAYKYSYEDKQISLAVNTQGDWVCFSVSDNGVGMSRRCVKKIFNRFYQVDQTLSRKAEGCGLGLSIVKFIVDAHHGSIAVESEPGKGSTFTAKLRVTD